MWALRPDYLASIPAPLFTNGTPSMPVSSIVLSAPYMVVVRIHMSVYLTYILTTMISR